MSTNVVFFFFLLDGSRSDWARERESTDIQIVFTPTPAPTPSPCLMSHVSLELETAQSLVLENLSHPFARPNILDVKLGTVLYEEGATEAKRKRMEETARQTTSLETGVRLTGFQVSALSRLTLLTFLLYKLCGFCPHLGVFRTCCLIPELSV